MTRHLFKLVWNRKRSNALMILEICVSFLVVFLVATLGLFFLDNYRHPLGFEWKNVWNVRVGTGQHGGGSGGGSPEQAAIFARLLQEIRSFGAVEAAAGTEVIPFEQGGMGGNWKIDGRDVQMGIDEVTPGFADVMGLQMVAGRWFQQADSGLAWEPIVIDRDLARTVYGSADPIGRPFGKPEPKERQRRVIGVVSDFRKSGELMPNDNFMFLFKGLAGPEARPLHNLLVRVRPGTPAEFEEALVKRMQAVAPAWSFEVQPLRQVRATSSRFFLTPLIVAGMLAFFLLLMVGLGLIGVLWQNLLQRTREIGLRRAAGASRAAVHRQLLLEQIVVTSLGVLLGALLVVQIPVLDLIGVLSNRVFASGLLFAIVTMYLISILCTLYPSTLAARVQPAEALRYE
ncbi:MAG TPA: ABC transporter permease [Thermoanaerobaculia bacterium]|jgi:putative ABC transport system permease protein|nr:ABC transporter permease [Thermoanaerobaculia bacterium]